MISHLKFFAPQRSPIFFAPKFAHMCKLTFALLFALMASMHKANAQVGTPIRVSMQPGLYSMLAYKVASANGYWQEAGLLPTFVSYPAGVPQIKGHADWDVGTTGTVPALIGARDFDLITIAIADDQSKTNVLMVRKELLEKLKQTKSIPTGTKIALSGNSTVDYAVQTCLALWGGKLKSDVVVVDLPQAQVIAAGAAQQVDYVGLWAPNMYTMQEKHGFAPLCSAKDFSPGIYGITFANREYAKLNPKVVARFLAVQMRAIHWMKRHPKETQALLIATAAKDGVTISPSAALSDYELRPLFDLAEQLELMAGKTKEIDDSPVARSFLSMNIFLNEGKVQSRRLRPSAFMDASFLRMVQADAELSKFAVGKKRGGGSKIAWGQIPPCKATSRS